MLGFNRYSKVRTTLKYSVVAIGDDCEKWKVKVCIYQRRVDVLFARTVFQKKVLVP